MAFERRRWGGRYDVPPFDGERGSECPIVRAILGSAREVLGPAARLARAACIERV
jgi:hypothetical protein